MNEFDVRLQPAAEDDLADVWVRSPAPSAVTRADAAAHQMLRSDPFGCGPLSPETSTG